MNKMSLKEIMFALLESIDLVNYLLKNHHRRVAIITHELCLELGFDKHQIKRGVLAAALHDVGALYVKEREQLIKLDIENPHPHAIRGAILLKDFNYFEEVSDIVLHHHRYWDHGQGKMFMNKEVPDESFIIHLADRIDILYDANKPYFLQKDEILEKIKGRVGKVFSEEYVEAFERLSKRESFWLNLDSITFVELLGKVFEDSEDVEVNLELLEHIAGLFAGIVDSRSVFTASHSRAVGEIAFALGELRGLDHDTNLKLKIAGLLHDLGKLGIPNEIIEKETRLTKEEYQQMKSHAFYTYQILRHMRGLNDICNWASMHHERRDGSGYPFHITDTDFSVEIDILAAADIFTALSENRPYREGLNNENILTFFEREFNEEKRVELLDIMKEHIDELNAIREQVQNMSYNEYRNNIKKINQMTDQMAVKTTAEKPQKSLQLH